MQNIERIGDAQKISAKTNTPLYTTARRDYSPSMSTEFDASEFVDQDFETARQSGFATTTVMSAPAPAPLPGDAQRAPTREEVDAQVGDKQQQLAELKRAQAELERERATLEETRRRQLEFTTGRQEMTHQLTRGIGLLEEAEFAARRDAEQMAKSLADLRTAQEKVNTIHDAAWTKGNFQTELTRANTTIENARLEWNSARQKFPVLSSKAMTEPEAAAVSPGPSIFAEKSFSELCRLGFALTWPIALGALAIFLVLLLRR